MFKTLRISSFPRLVSYRRVFLAVAASLAIMVVTVTRLVAFGKIRSSGDANIPNHGPDEVRTAPFVSDANWTLADIQNRRRDPENRLVAHAVGRMPRNLPPALPPSARNRTRRFSKLLVYNRHEATAQYVHLLKKQAVRTLKGQCNENIF